jgi:uncharacterized protein (DUF2336 family)
VKASSVTPQLEILDNITLLNAAEIRPALVRVLTHFYVHKPAHTSEEEQQYTELVLRLIDSVDIATRKMIAAKLAKYPAAPTEVVRRLARDVLEVARPILEHSQRLTRPDLLAVIAECGPSYAAVISHRLTIKTDEKVAAAERGSAAEARALVPASAGGPLGRQRACIPPPVSPEAPREPRKLDSTNDPHLPSWGAPGRNVFGHLEATAIERNPAEFVCALERTLGISAEHAQRIVAHEGGEPLLVAAKALGMPIDMFLRILLLLNPMIGKSLVRVFGLAKLYDALSREAALRLVASLRSAGARNVLVDCPPRPSPLTCH